MNLKKIAAALSMAGATVFSGGALADPSITNVDGTFTPFGGFDWASASGAWTSGFSGVVGSTFALNYVGWAVSVTDLLGQEIEQFSNLDATANGVKKNANAYEYTVVATFNEKIIGCVSASQCTFQVTGGTFDIYYDVAANAVANTAAWANFGDGTKILSGVFFGGTTTTFTTTAGGQANLNGLVTYTNNAFINPNLVSTNVTSTLQLGSAVTNFASPTSLDGNAIGAGQIVFQADANQTFSARVPEPASLALVGLALGGLGFVARRRK
ncbi:flocculation-associated PEP-CTERM protein PepA [Roseateles sp. LYH14W]|uniref:Flocculation-associated PEP-CTERM protein PepA n=1 Tax=Pelomonas parva TaxID=3299032 RepID=A0ABW7EZT2_9BURK